MLWRPVRVNSRKKNILSRVCDEHTTSTRQAYDGHTTSTRQAYHFPQWAESEVRVGYDYDFVKKWFSKNFYHKIVAIWTFYMAAPVCGRQLLDLALADAILCFFSLLYQPSPIVFTPHEWTNEPQLDQVRFTWHKHNLLYFIKYLKSSTIYSSILVIFRVGFLSTNLHPDATLIFIASSAGASLITSTAWPLHSLLIRWHRVNCDEVLSVKIKAGV